MITRRSFFDLLCKLSLIGNLKECGVQQPIANSTVYLFTNTGTITVSTYMHSNLDRPVLGCKI